MVLHKIYLSCHDCHQGNILWLPFCSKSTQRLEIIFIWFSFNWYLYFLCTKVSEMCHSFCSNVERRDKGGGLRTAVAPALLLVLLFHGWMKMRGKAKLKLTMTKRGVYSKNLFIFAQSPCWSRLVLVAEKLREVPLSQDHLCWSQLVLVAAERRFPVFQVCLALVGLVS